MSSSLKSETARITDLIDREQLGEVESVWMEALEKAPSEVETFLSLADRLAKSGHGEKAGVLLELVATRLGELEQHNEAFEVVGKISEVAPRNARQKQLAEEIAGRCFAELPGFDKCIERAEERAKGAGGEFVRELYAELKFQPDDWVFHSAGWGLGQVKEIDAEDGWVVVDFDEKKGHRVKMGAAASFFEKIPPDDIQVQRVANLDELKARCDDDAEGVVMGILKSHGNKTTLKRIKAELVPVVIVARNWAKWWQAVRKALATHQYIKLGTGTNPNIERVVKAMTLEDETRERFDNAHRLHMKLQIIRRYLKDSDKGDERSEFLRYVDERMREFETGQVESHAPEGEQVLISYLLRDLKKAEPSLSGDSPYDTATLIKDPEALISTLPQIRDSEYQQKAIEHHCKLNRDGWPEVLGRAFLLGLPAIWDGIAKRLYEVEREDVLAGALEVVQTEADAHPLQYLWLAKRSITGGKLPEGLKTPEPEKMFGRLLWLINKVLTNIERGQTHLKDTLSSLRSAMTEKQSRLLTTSLEGLNAEKAGHLLHEIERCRGLSDIHSSSLRDVLMRRFPNLKAAKQVAEEGHDEPGREEILATRNGLRKREDELRRIQDEELPDVAKQIGEALAMGDISENAELDAARERESRLKAHAKEIMDELRRVRVVEPEEYDEKHAGFGTRVTLRHESGAEVVYSIFGRYEADHENNIISVDSPIAKGILGRAPGETAEANTPEGTVSYTVVSVERVG